MRFSVDFEKILNVKWQFYVEIIILIIVVRICWGEVQGIYTSSHENILKYGAFWCILVRFDVYFDQIVFENFFKNDIILYKTYFYIKINYYIGTSLLWAT